jgi:hypothetical protein
MALWILKEVLWETEAVPVRVDGNNPHTWCEARFSLSSHEWEAGKENKRKEEDHGHFMVLTTAHEGKSSKR